MVAHSDVISTEHLSVAWHLQRIMSKYLPAIRRPLYPRISQVCLLETQPALQKSKAVVSSASCKVSRGAASQVCHCIVAGSAQGRQGDEPHCRQLHSTPGDDRSCDSAPGSASQHSGSVHHAPAHIPGTGPALSTTSNQSPSLRGCDRELPA